MNKVVNHQLRILLEILVSMQLVNHQLLCWSLAVKLLNWFISSNKFLIADWFVGFLSIWIIYPGLLTIFCYEHLW